MSRYSRNDWINILRLISFNIYSSEARVNHRSNTISFPNIIYSVKYTS